MFLKLAKVKIAVIFFDLIYWEFVWIYFPQHNSLVSIMLA